MREEAVSNQHSALSTQKKLRTNRFYSRNGEIYSMPIPYLEEDHESAGGAEPEESRLPQYDNRMFTLASMNGAGRQVADGGGQGTGMNSGGAGPARDETTGSSQGNDIGSRILALAMPPEQNGAR